MARNGLETTHKLRYTKARIQGLSLEEIAAEEGVTVATINASIKAYELYREANSEENLRLVQGSVVLANSEHEKETLRRALKAKRKEVVEVERKVEKDGEVTTEIGHEIIEVDDFDVQLRAVETITQKAEAVLPKKGMSINNTTNMGFSVQQGSGGAVGISFEDRLRKIQEKRRGLLSPAEAVAEEVPDAIVVDPAPEECWIPLN